MKIFIASVALRLTLWPLLLLLKLATRAIAHMDRVSGVDESLSGICLHLSREGSWPFVRDLSLRDKAEAALLDAAVCVAGAREAHAHTDWAVCMLPNEWDNYECSEKELGAALTALLNTPEPWSAL